MQIALVRLSSMGDIILQTPILLWLKSMYPSVNITFITLDSFKGLLDGHPLVDDILYLKRLKGKADIIQLKKLSKDIDREFDLVIDLHGTLRANLIRFFLTTTPVLRVYKRSFLRWLFIKFKLDFLKDLETHHFRVIKDFQFLFDDHIEREKLESNLQQRTGISGTSLTSVPSSFEPKKDVEPYIVISPVASFKNKRWPMKKVKAFLQLVLEDPDLERFKFYIIAGPDDKYCDEIFYGTELLSSDRVINLQGKTSIKESIEYIGNAKVIVTNDTGTSHMAEAYGVPSICLFGPTSESFGFKTHLTNSVSISAKNISCRPCSGTGAKKCFKKNLECMESIEAPEVLGIMKRVLC